MKNFIYSAMLVVFISGCSQVQRATDLITKPTAREIYIRDFKPSDSLLEIWNASFAKAKLNLLEADVPFTLTAQSQKNTAAALGYKIGLKRGEILKVSVDNTADSGVVFIDLFKFETDSTLSKKPVVSNQWQSDSISYNIERSGNYHIVIQPALRDSLIYNVKIYTQPSLGFPVLGKENAAIGSFWGAKRSGGKRSHEGIDIFAQRGTPVVAVTNGYISFTGEKGLGGKQVWLRDGFFGQSLYYAHLDSIIIADGARVKIGDTLGLVGNTGNAKTTSTHLHFGIYTRAGAIDPLPFVKKRAVPTLKNEDLYFTKAITKGLKNELRTGASVSSNRLATLPKDQQLTILGKTQHWYHVRISDSLEGFMHQSLLNL